MKNFCIALLVGCLLIAGSGDSFAFKGGGFGGGGRSFSSRSFSSSKPSSSSKSWGNSSSSRPKSATAVSKPLVKRETAKSVADRKTYEAAKSSGKAFATKSAAVADFKAKAKSDPKVQESLTKTYPTTFTAEPKTRPAYIPPSYNGSPVIYNNGGYGYRGSDGSFNMLMTYMLVDSLSDSMMMSSMRSNGYHVGAAPTPQHTTVAADADEGIGFWGAIFIVLGIVGIVALLILISSAAL